MNLLPIVEREKFDPSRIKLLRAQKKLSPAELGKMIGKSRMSIINWEKGRTSPNMRDIDRMTELFDMSKDFFWAK